MQNYENEELILSLECTCTVKLQTSVSQLTWSKYKASWVRWGWEVRGGQWWWWLCRFNEIMVTAPLLFQSSRNVRSTGPEVWRALTKQATVSFEQNRGGHLRDTHDRRKADAATEPSAFLPSVRTTIQIQHWPLASLWQIDEPSQSALVAYKRTPLDRPTGSPNTIVM